MIARGEGERKKLSFWFTKFWKTYRVNQNLHNNLTRNSKIKATAKASDSAQTVKSRSCRSYSPVAQRLLWYGDDLQICRDTYPDIPTSFSPLSWFLFPRSLPHIRLSHRPFIRISSSALTLIGAGSGKRRAFWHWTMPTQETVSQYRSYSIFKQNEFINTLFDQVSPTLLICSWKLTLTYSLPVPSSASPSLPESILRCLSGTFCSATSTLLNNKIDYRHLQCMDSVPLCPFIP